MSVEKLVLKFLSFSCTALSLQSKFVFFQQIAVLVVEFMTSVAALIGDTGPIDVPADTHKVPAA